jgi:hypothetical protein
VSLLASIARKLVSMVPTSSRQSNVTKCPDGDTSSTRAAGRRLATLDAGLHQLLGYGAITFDNEDEGRKIASYARSGMTVKDAWLSAAKEVQPATNGESAPDGPTVWAGVMWVGKNSVDPINDHAWSHGSVSSDPTSPTFLACMWTVC